MRTTRQDRTRALSLVLLLGLIASGCSKAPKPDELMQIEARFQNPKTRELRTIDGAKRSYQDAYQMRLRAQDAYNDGNMDSAREYAIRSQLKLRTAETIALQLQAKRRFDEANATLQETNKKLIAVNQTRNKLVREVGVLERDVAVAKRRKDAEAQRLAALNSRKNTPMGGQVDKQRLAAVDARISQVEDAKKQALSVKADKHAAILFNKANNQLNSMKALRRTTPVPFALIEQSATMAVNLFSQAAMKAKPGFQVQVAKQDPAKRRAQLLSQAQSAFGMGSAMLEGTSVRVVVSGLFNPRSSDFSSSAPNSIDALVKLAGTFDEFSVRVEGFTSTNGSATDNLAISQLRARKTRDQLVAKGVKKGRITDDTGHGQGRTRYSPGSDARNDRVEVIFTRN